MTIEDEVERDIVEYLCTECGVEPEEITDESTLNDLGLDSLGVAVLGDIIENKYGLSLDDERIARVQTFSDLKEFIALKRPANPEDTGNLVDDSSIGATSA